MVKSISAEETNFLFRCYFSDESQEVEDEEEEVFEDDDDVLSISSDDEQTGQPS